MRSVGPRAAVRLSSRACGRSLCLLMVMLLCAGVAANPLSAQGRPPLESDSQIAALSRRMNQFLQDVRQRSEDSIAMAFPRQGELEYRRTLHVNGDRRTSVWRFPAADVPAALTRGPLYESFNLNPHSQPIGRFMHQAILRQGRWRRVLGNRFVPPGAPASSPLFVEWRREDGRWVISAFGDEGYGAGAAVPKWCC